MSLEADLLRQLELFSLHSRRAFLGQRQGVHISPRKGHGMEFSDYRQYELGDNPRHIDWGLYARTDRLYVKRYQEEEDLTALLLLDTSASMFTDTNGMKWKRAKTLIESIAYVGLLSHDSVAVSFVGVQDLTVYTSPGSFHEIARRCDGMGRENAKTFSAQEVLRAASQVRFPGVAVLVSDCLVERKELYGALNILRAKNLSITVVCVLGEQDVQPLSIGDQGMCIDSESSEVVELVWDSETEKNYARALSQHVQEIGQFCRSSGMSFIEWRPTVSVESLLFTELPKLGVLR